MPQKLCVRLPFLKNMHMVQWLIYHYGQANENFWIALSSDPGIDNLSNCIFSWSQVIES